MAKTNKRNDFNKPTYLKIAQIDNFFERRRLNDLLYYIYNTDAIFTENITIEKSLDVGNSTIYVDDNLQHVNIGSSATTNSKFFLLGTDPSESIFCIKKPASLTENILEIRDENDTILNKFDNNGNLVIGINLRQSIGHGLSPTAALDLSGASTSRASLRIRTGVEPTTPNVGDIYFDGTNFKGFNGAWIDFGGSGSSVAIGSPISGATANRILYNDSSNNLADSSGLTYDGSGVLSVSSRIGVPTLRASGSGGLLLENNNGDDVLLLGAGSGQGATFYGGVNITNNLIVDTNVLYVDTTNNTLAISDTPVSGRKLQIKGESTTDKLLVLKSVSSQTGNHWESRHSDDTIQSKIRYDGNFVLGGDFNEFNGNRETILTIVPNGTQGLNAIAITDGGSNYNIFRRDSWYTNGVIRIESYQTSPYTSLMIGQNGISIGKTGLSAASASLHVYGRKTDQVTTKIQAISSQTVDLTQWLDSSSTKLVGITIEGGISPCSMADSSAQNNTIYFSTDSSKLVYKDSGGTVNQLY